MKFRKLKVEQVLFGIFIIMAIINLFAKSIDVFIVSGMVATIALTSAIIYLEKSFKVLGLLLITVVFICIVTFIGR